MICSGPGLVTCGLLVASTAFAGCSDPVPDPTLESIESIVFKPRCGEPGCHGVDFPRQGLALYNSTIALQTTVNVPPLVGDSATVFPARIVPGDPDQSFLVTKIEGPPETMGLRMPSGRTPLSDGTIAAIRTWIAGLQP